MLHRRSIVARMRLRGMRTVDIWAALQKQGVINPETEEPWKYDVIAADIRRLDEELAEEAMLSTAVHRHRQVEELREVRREAWRAGRLEIVLKALDAEADLLGTRAPTRMDVTSDNKQIGTARDVIAILQEIYPTAQLEAPTIIDATLG